MINEMSDRDIDNKLVDSEFYAHREDDRGEGKPSLADLSS